ncbi:hypothetical protein V6N12_025996 [Hibiscus sabdariffa]|uniref:Uncharacterized protein n=1 Tax=Hibiscus sabdariffa TaxID=183260 RepID=A0ABR2DQG8_9ROSI
MLLGQQEIGYSSDTIAVMEVHIEIKDMGRYTIGLFGFKTIVGEVVSSHFDSSSVERCTEIRVELPLLSAGVIVHASQWGSVALSPVGQEYTSLTFQSNDNP